MYWNWLSNSARLFQKLSQVFCLFIPDPAQYIHTGRKKSQPGSTNQTAELKEIYKQKYLNVNIAWYNLEHYNNFWKHDFSTVHVNAVKVTKNIHRAEKFCLRFTLTSEGKIFKGLKGNQVHSSTESQLEYHNVLNVA